MIEHWTFFLGALLGGILGYAYSKWLQRRKDARAARTQLPPHQRGQNQDMSKAQLELLWNDERRAKAAAALKEYRTRTLAEYGNGRAGKK